MPRLSDEWFEAKFYGEADAKGLRYLPSIEGAQGVLFWCPCGYGKPDFPLEGGRPHAVMVPFRNPRNAAELPPDHGPTSAANPSGPRPRWLMAGTGISDLDLSPSVAVGKDPECWHGYIRNGEVTG